WGPNASVGDPLPGNDDGPAPWQERGRRGERGSDLALLLDLGGLAAQAAQVVQLGATDVTAAEDLDLLDHGRVQREGALHADAEADLADREGAADARALHLDADTLEHLHTGAVALNDVDVHLEGVAGAEVGD